MRQCDMLKLIGMVKDALNQLYHDDSYLIYHDLPVKRNGNETNVGERTVVFRFAHYFCNLIESTESVYREYTVDCEYNRNEYDQKFLYGQGILEQEKNKRVYPDVVVHKRGTGDNLLVMEFKTYWGNDHRYDRKKLKEFTNHKGTYKYQLGMAIMLNEYSYQIDFFENGEITRSYVSSE